MDFEKTKKSFAMRFGRDCEGVCFCGRGITLIRGTNTSLCASLSVGGCTAASTRKDGRFTAEFDDNQKYISSNISELMYHKKEPQLELLSRVQAHGATLGGADILFSFNTKIYQDYEPLLLSSTYLFCPKTVPPIELKACLTRETAFAEMIGKRETVLLSKGEKYQYIKISDKAVKIVLCCVKEENHTEEVYDGCAENAARSLSAGDYEGFAEIITREYREMVRLGRIGRKTKALFELATELKDALGYGILEEGGIFAVVENKKVNGFVQNIRTEYENYCGAPPEFYITSTENSGINAIKKTYKGKQPL